MTNSLQVTDDAAQAVATKERVTLATIQAAIAERHDTNGATAMQVPIEIGPKGNPTNLLGLLSICILVMKNGFTVIGKSAPASPENFNAELGKQFAYEDAIRQLWPLMGFALRDRLSKDA
jgi:N4 Gp49/Sf6 Gp66 family protein